MDLTYRGCSYKKKVIPWRVISNQGSGSPISCYCMFQRSSVKRTKQSSSSIKSPIQDHSQVAPEATIHFLGCSYEIRTVSLEPLAL